MSYKDKCLKLAQLYKEASITGQPFLCSGLTTKVSPGLLSNLDEWSVKPKEEWRNNLFENCYILKIYFHEYKEATTRLFIYDSLVKQEMCNGIEYRLPTIKESPRNVWLVPHDEKPEGFDDLQIILRNKLNNTWLYDVKMDKYNVEEITAFMIMENL